MGRSSISPTVPQAPPSSSPAQLPGLAWSSGASQPQTVGQGEVLFIEFFSGPEAHLARCVADAGITVAQPQDLVLGGADFRDATAVDELLAQLHRWHQAGFKIVVHMGTPCSTFSKARDRARRTKVRSLECPEGLPPLAQATVDGNIMAAASVRVATFVVESLGGSASLENPGRSYLWPFVDT